MTKNAGFRKRALYCCLDRLYYTEKLLNWFICVYRADVLQTGFLKSSYFSLRRKRELLNNHSMLEIYLLDSGGFVPPLCVLMSLKRRVRAAHGRVAGPTTSLYRT